MSPQVIAPTKRLAIAALTFNAFAWGVSWWPLRQLDALGLHALWATALVYGFAVVCLFAARPGAWAAFLSSPLLWLLACASGLTNMGFNWAVTVGDVVRVVLLFYLMPAWSVLLAWPVLGERPTLAALVRVALSLAGVALILKTPETPWPVPSGLVDWLAIVGGLSFALTNTLLRRLHAVPAESRALAMFGGGGLAAAIAAMVGMTQGLVLPLPAPSMALAGLALLLAFALLVGNLALQYGAARLAAHTTALVLLSEVVFASVSAVLLGAAQMTQGVWLGGSLIVAAAVWSALAPSALEENQAPAATSKSH